MDRQRDRYINKQTHSVIVHSFGPDKVQFLINLSRTTLFQDFSSMCKNATVK